MKSVQPTFAIFSDNNNDGFTLVEALMGLVVFSFGILGVMTMTINANSGFTNARINNLEVNRTTTNLETLKEVGYENDEIFKGTDVTAQGSDGKTVGYNDTNDAVVGETKLIVIQNNRITGPGGNYQVYYTKPLIEN